MSTAGSVTGKRWVGHTTLPSRCYRNCSGLHPQVPQFQFKNCLRVLDDANEVNHFAPIIGHFVSVPWGTERVMLAASALFSPVHDWPTVCCSHVARTE